MPYVSTDDECDIYIKEWGEPDAPPVILIHGWPLNADSWDDVANALAEDGFRTIAYDRRGFGRSEQPWDGYDYDTLADDLAAVIDQCDAEGAAIVGFSMGGGEVARYLSRHGTQNVSRAALIASVVPYMLKTDDNAHGVPAEQFEGMDKTIREDRPAFLQTFAKMFYGVGVFSKPVSQGVLDATFAMAVMAGQRPTLQCMEAFARTDFREDCAAFDLPTLIIHGTGDSIVPIDGSARAAVKLIPHATLIEYDGGPHGLLATHKDEIVRDLTTFLRGMHQERATDDAGTGDVFPEASVNAAPGLQPMM